MTGNIKESLEKSEAVASLRMEGAVAELFRTAGWETSRNVYYIDGETAKIRETDVLAKKTLDWPRRRKGIGAPIVNIKIVCECKSLSSSNIIFHDDENHSHPTQPKHFWIGSEEEVKSILKQLRTIVKMEKIAEITLLTDYFYERAYMNHEQGLNSILRNYLPPVDIVTRAWRETKDGKLKEVESGNGLVGNPMWNAIRSAMSASEAVLKNTREASLSWLSINEISYRNAETFVHNLAFFYDAELLRHVIHHPIVVSKARLWNASHSDFQEVSSARCIIQDLNHHWTHVDIVTEAGVEQYIAKATHHFEQSARRAISELWKMIDRIGWEPGGRESLLSNVLTPCLSRL